jgi:hypothetical protein
MLCIPRSWDKLSFKRLQAIGSFFMAFNHSVWSFPLGCELPFGGVSSHQVHLSQHPVSNLKFPGVNSFVIILSYSTSIGLAYGLRIILSFLQQIKVQSDPLIIKFWVILGNFVARGAYFGRYNCLGSFCQREWSFPGRSPGCCSV